MCSNIKRSEIEWRLKNVLSFFFYFQRCATGHIKKNVLLKWLKQFQLKNDISYFFIFIFSSACGDRLLSAWIVCHLVKYSKQCSLRNAYFVFRQYCCYCCRAFDSNQCTYKMEQKQHPLFDAQLMCINK